MVLGIECVCSPYPSWTSNFFTLSCMGAIVWLESWYQYGNKLRTGTSKIMKLPGKEKQLSYNPELKSLTYLSSFSLAT